MRTVIRLHPAAPAKPPVHAPCNGCGVCCASEPCPPGMLASRRTTGACAALVWNAVDARYRCGVVTRPSAYLPRGLRWAAGALSALARRYIAAGSGCDCDAVVASQSADG